MKYKIIESYKGSKNIETEFSGEDLLKIKSEAELFFAAKRKELNSSKELTGKVELGIISESGEYYSLSGRSLIAFSFEAVELLKFAKSNTVDTAQKENILAMLQMTLDEKEIFRLRVKAGKNVKQKR